MVALHLQKGDSFISRKAPLGSFPVPSRIDFAIIFEKEERMYYYRTCYGCRGLFDLDNVSQILISLERNKVAELSFRWRKKQSVRGG